MNEYHSYGEYMKSDRFDLNLIRVFLVVYQSGSISNAVKQLHLTQPAISNALKRLNTLLSCKLFVRKGRHIHPTPEATDLYNLLRQPYEDISQAVSGFNSFDPATTTRQFAVSLSGLFDVMMPELSTFFQEIAPHAKLTRFYYDFDKNIKGLEDGTLDFMVTAVEQLPGNLISMPLGEEKLVLATRKNHPLIKNRNKLSIKTIKNLRFASLLVEYEAAVPAYYIQYQIGANVCVRVGGFNNLLDIARESDYAVVLPKIIAYHHQSDIDYFDLPIQSPIIRLNIAWGRHNAENQGHRWFRQLIFDMYKKYEPD